MAQGYVRTYGAVVGDGPGSNPWNHTIDSTATETNRTLIVGIAYANNGTTGSDPGMSVTYDGNTPTGSIDTGQLTGGTSNPDFYWDFVYWSEADLPASGNATLAISFSTIPEQSYGVAAVLLEHSQQSITLAADGIETTVTTGTAFGGSVTPVSPPNSIIHICFECTTTNTWTAATGYTERYDAQAGTGAGNITAYLGTYMGYDDTTPESNSATLSSSASRGISWKARVFQQLPVETSGGAAVIMGL